MRRLDEAPVPGGDFDGDASTLTERLARHSGLEHDLCGRLARLYGCEAFDVIDRGTTLVHPNHSVLDGEVHWAVENEGAATLEDVLYRRLRLPIFDRDASATLVEPLARVLAPSLAWTEDRAAQEIAAVRARLRDDLAFRGTTPDPSEAEREVQPSRAAGSAR